MLLQRTLDTLVGLFVLAALAVFVYMGFQIGSFRFDRSKYVHYVLYFKDISGLARKADVKIAGVKVGWVEHVELVSNEHMQAKADVMVLRDFALYSDAYAVVRQDGLLGPKYVEVIPGDPFMRTLEPDETLGKPSIAPVSIDEMMQRFSRIAGNIEDVTESLKFAIGGVEGKKQLRSLVDNMAESVEHFSSFARILDRTFIENESNIGSLLSIGVTINGVADKLEQDVFPAFQESIEKISQVFDRDFNRIASRVESTTQALEDASIQAREGLRNISSVAEKIDEGKGLLGKLVNEDETYQDLRVAVRGFKNYLAKIDRTEIVIDSHFEVMHRPAEHFRYEDNKSYFDIRIHPSEGHFYVVQFVGTQKGFVYRKEVRADLVQSEENPIEVDQFVLEDVQPTDRAFRLRKTRIERNKFLLSLQFAKVFKDIAVRFGLFENTGGIGIDIDLPLRTQNFRWVTTFEAFDSIGWNRIDDRRPHLKWLNRMFFMRNLYFTFGADDFISKRNASAFVGGGLRFDDDDFKYLVSSISGLGSSMLSQ
jgi:phospholipid/cholesterol/gamma-HCH transport system substrate-binding protein